MIHHHITPLSVFLHHFLRKTFDEEALVDCEVQVRAFFAFDSVKIAISFEEQVEVSTQAHRRAERDVQSTIDRQRSIAATKHDPPVMDKTRKALFGETQWSFAPSF